MKDTVQHAEAQERMAPGKLTAGGFLGEDERAVALIVAEDEASFRRAGIEPEAAAIELKRLRDAGSRGLGEPVTVDGTWLVSSGDARGKLPCPYEDGIFHKNSIWVRRIASGETVVFSDLSLHLLAEHHFCQGKGSPFRLEPAVLASLLAK
jgi:hypothetical protein